MGSARVAIVGLTVGSTLHIRPKMGVQRGQEGEAEGVHAERPQVQSEDDMDTCAFWGGALQLRGERAGASELFLM